MNKTVALLLLVGAVAACDPWLDDNCLERDNLPRRAMGAYWLHGIMSYIQAVYMFGIMGAYISGLSILGPLMEGFAFAAAGLNFIVYIPNAIIWTLTATTTEPSRPPTSSDGSCGSSTLPCSSCSCSPPSSTASSQSLLESPCHPSSSLSSDSSSTSPSKSSTLPPTATPEPS